MSALLLPSSHALISAYFFCDQPSHTVGHQNNGCLEQISVLPLSLDTRHREATTDLVFIQPGVDHNIQE